MNKVIGPACEHCGCRDSTVVSEGQDWRPPRGDERGSQVAVYERRRCRHCGHRWRTVKDDDDATPIADLPVWPGTVCPHCGSAACKVQSSPRDLRPVRKMKCESCGHAFKAMGPE